MENKKIMIPKYGLYLQLSACLLSLDEVNNLLPTERRKQKIRYFLKKNYNIKYQSTYYITVPVGPNSDSLYGGFLLLHAFSLGEMCPKQ